MKKLFLVLGIAAFCFGAISCKKQCECTTYLLGEVVSTNSYEVDSKDDCLKANTYVESIGSGVKCKRK